MVSATTDRRQGLTGDKGFKAPVQAATTANIVLSGEQTVGGVAVKAIGVNGYPDRVLVWNQTNPVQNGIWDVSTASWTRSQDANGSQDLVTGTMGLVTGGTYLDQFWIITTTGAISPGSTALAFQVGIPSLPVLGASNGASLVGSAAWYAATVIGFNAGSVPDGATVIFAGRSVANDGGGGAFTYFKTSTQTADNGTVFAPGVGRLIRNGWTVFGFNGPVNIKWFGALGDGATANTDAQAFNLIAANLLFTHMYMPNGQYIANTPLLMANRGATGVPLLVEGDGAQFDNGGGTTFLMRTGTYMADFTASQYITLRGIHFLSNGTGASTMGIIMGRTTGTGGGFAQSNIIQDCIINLPSVPGASVLGSVGIVNHSAEICQLRGCYVVADTPIAYQLGKADFSFPAPPSGNVLLAAGISMTTCSNYDCTFQARTGYTMVLSGASNIVNYNCTFDLIAGNVTNAAVLIQKSLSNYQSSSNIRFVGGDIEHFPAIAYITADMKNLVIDTNISGITSDNILAYAGITIDGLRLRINDPNLVAANLVKATGGTVTVLNADISLATNQKQTDTNVVFTGGTINVGLRDVLDTTTVNLAQASTAVITGFNNRIRASATFNPGAILNGAAYVSAALPVTGAAVGDFVQVAAPYSLGGCTVTGYGYSAGNVQIAIANNTGGTVTLASGAWKMIISKI